MCSSQGFRIIKFSQCCLVRKDNAAANLNVIRKIVPNILK